MLESINIQKYQDIFLSWLLHNVMTIDVMVQSLLIVIALIAGLTVRRIFAPAINARIDSLSLHFRTKNALKNISRIIAQITTICILMIAMPLIVLSGHQIDIANATLSLIIAWVIIRLAVQVIENSAIRNLFAFVIWTITALSILGIMDQTTSTLDNIGVNIGQGRLSALSVTKVVLVLSLLLYIALFVSRLLERRVDRVKSLTVSSRVLINKIMRASFVSLAILIGVTTAGIDLSLLAVFSGAVGLGVGFGLQKGISNLFSGMLLLMDKSIKPGDIIELPSITGKEAFGWVQHMGARYTEIVTRDNISYLIPNEELITRQVVNWSHGSSLIRQEINFGVDYRHNPYEIREMALEVLKNVDRICHEEESICHFYDYADNGMRFILRYWINDPENGTLNVRGQIMLGLWDTFRENGIMVPYPHREVYFHDVGATERPAPEHKPAPKTQKPKT